MTNPIDTTFGEGTTQKLVDYVTIDGDVPSITQSWITDKNRILVVLIWSDAAQTLALDLDNMHVTWIIGMCATVADSNTIDFTAKVAGATMPLADEFGFKTASALAYNQMASFLQQQGMEETQTDLYVADLTDSSFLQEYRPDA